MQRAAAAPHTHPGAFDAAVAVLGLLALLAWDASSLDHLLIGAFGNASGFAWRESFFTSQVLHQGGRLLAWVLLASQVLAALRKPAPAAASHGPSRTQRWFWVAVILVCAVGVPALKQFSATSCPWDLAEFGGVARTVSHWQWGVADGGPGRCFPSGHAVAAFAFFGLYFLWRDHDAQRARRWLLAVLALGLVFGAGQLVRGAHYPSHTLWSAWLCWVVCTAAAHVMSRARRGATWSEKPAADRQSGHRAAPET